MAARYRPHLLGAETPLIRPTRERVSQLCENGSERLDEPIAVAVVGGGIAGLASASVLAERGARVTVFEKEAFLGGRAGAWGDVLADGTEFEMERGFHAFFRQYYNLRGLLQRIDPDLSMLKAVDDYPILGPSRQESFANLSRIVPLNVAQLVVRTETMKWRDLLKVNVKRALAMLAYDQEQVYLRYDAISAGEYLDSLNFPPEARRMLFDVFAHSFFNPEGEMSAAELLMMFHFYFTGNPEGLVFDIANAPFSTALWEPMRAYLESFDVEFELETGVDAIDVLDSSEGGARFAVHANGRTTRVDAVVLALSVEPLKKLVSRSQGLGHDDFQRSIASLELTRPFVVWRLWLEEPVQGGRAPFVGTTGVGILDNISIYEKIEDESATWSAAKGGSIVELHAYSVDPAATEAEIKAELYSGLVALYPETDGIKILDERFLYSRDCPAFAPGSWKDRPEVGTAIAGLCLAGDFVKLPIPSALMERAATAGIMAANHILAGKNVRSEPVWSVPQRGLVPPRFLGARIAQ